MLDFPFYWQKWTSLRCAWSYQYEGDDPILVVYGYVLGEIGWLKTEEYWRFEVNFS